MGALTSTGALVPRLALFLLPVFLGAQSLALLEKVTQVIRLVVSHAERYADDLVVRGLEKLLHPFHPDGGEVIDEGHRHLLREYRAEMRRAQGDVRRDRVERDIGVVVVRLDVLAGAANDLFVMARVAAVPKLYGLHANLRGQLR